LAYQLSFHLFFPGRLAAADFEPRSTPRKLFLLFAHHGRYFLRLDRFQNRCRSDSASPFGIFTAHQVSAPGPLMLDFAGCRYLDSLF
jgi:hypothetical protein